LPENRQITCIHRANDDASRSRDVAFSGVAAFISRSDASWPPAGIRKPAVADLMRPAQFGHHQPRGKKVTLMDKVAVAASKSDATVVLFDIGVTAEAKI
jgi:hypothetical protein